MPTLSLDFVWRRVNFGVREHEDGKWLDRSFIMRLLSLKVEILLVKILSIRVVLGEVVPVGFEISG